MEKISSDNILKFMQDHDMVNVEDVLSQIEIMKNQEILNQHPYAISQGSNKRWYTYLPDISKPNGRRQIAKSSKEKVEKEVIQYYKQKDREENQKNIQLRDLYACWMHWRKMATMRWLRLLLALLVYSSKQTLTHTNTL